jgi:outer membrane protein OmpA-like peptidoglycan-associated protein
LTSQTAVGRQTASYRHGLVLGLTMAEIMLLLVFCLLIAVGVALSSERAQRDDALTRLKRVESAAASNAALVDALKRNSRLSELLDQMARSMSRREIDDFWRKLVESNDVVTRMERQGIPLAALEDNEYAAKLQELLAQGVDPDKITRALALASAIDAAMPQHLSPQQIAALLQKELASSKPLEEPPKPAHNWPPIINLSEAGGYYFATGSADLTPIFAGKLRTVVVERLLEIAESFDVDVIEVIGHTDEQPVNTKTSNLDRSLPSVMTGGTSADLLQWGDNAGLGLARALAVVELLAGDFRLRNFRILPLSAAQLTGIDGRLTRWDNQGDVRERRRIEIRMRKSS